MYFEPITIRQRPLIDKYLSVWGLENSIYTASNLIMWGHEGKLKVAEEDSTLYILGHYENEPPFMYAPLTLDKHADYAEAVEAGRQEMLALGISPLFRGISELPLELFRTQCRNYTLELDLDNCDYIYESEKLISLSGKKLHAKRNHINQFIAEHPDYSYVKLTPDMKDEALVVQLSWLENKEALLPGMDGEYDAIRLLFEHMDELGIVGGGIMLNDKLVAFSLGQRISERMMVVHIEKGDDNIPGIYAIINQRFTEANCSGLIYVNREEDMGIPGLRRAKRSYLPAFMIDKYTARPIA
ncbi:MAG: phosphatidylglycerol lysyltransferase domain-containing protein [Clostridiales bacterium]|nr:phosphatidylglycerol lysyltransferase domain-containing protein [Clostridiales bacterium]MDD7550535.1 phosphatidylglycerol lysyltransferase domain-containing protein [Clostridia bacterium]MDY5754203.1 phosphatidylglycerol lysyltransferase domain-containing protein [Eubacteriales bacterium]